MIDTLRHAWAPRIAALFAALGLLLFARELSLAFARHEPIAAPPALLAPSVPPARVLSAPETVSALIDQQPFGEPGLDAEASAPATSATPSGLVQCVGIIAGGSSPLAACRLDGGATRLLHIGETLGPWTLERIEIDRVAFIDAARARREVRLTPPGN